MPKTALKIGFEHTEETDPINHPGVYTENIVERKYYAEILKNMDGVSNPSEQVNANVLLTNRFSIIADPFMKENYASMRYLCYMGTKWAVSTVEVQYPRLIVSAGRVYNAH